MTPETWLPTCTVVTAESVPVAVTVTVMLPRSTSSVRYCPPPSSLPRRRKNSPTSTPNDHDDRDDEVAPLLVVVL